MQKSSGKNGHKKASRKQPFTVYGRFLLRRGGAADALEIWEGEAINMAAAMRRAISEFWRRPKIKWKHHAVVNLQAKRGRL